MSLASDLARVHEARAPVRPASSSRRARPAKPRARCLGARGRLAARDAAARLGSTSNSCGGRGASWRQRRRSRKGLGRRRSASTPTARRSSTARRADRRGEDPDPGLGLPSLRLHLRRGPRLGRPVLPPRPPPGPVREERPGAAPEAAVRARRDHRDPDAADAPEWPARGVRRADLHPRRPAQGLARSAPLREPVLCLRDPVPVDRDRGAARAWPAPARERDCCGFRRSR